MTIYRDFPKATLCSFCKITVSHRDSGISIVIPNICLVGGGGIHFLSQFYGFFLVELLLDEMYQEFFASLVKVNLNI
jgi:hypothetical protein